MFTIMVDSLAVVVMSVGGCGWKKYKKMSEVSQFSSISQRQMVISHEGGFALVQFN